MKFAWLFAAFWALVQLLYFPTWDAGFVTDFTGLLQRLEGAPASGILRSFGFPAQQQVLNAFLYSFYHLFGTAPLPWYLIHTTLHALNGWLLYRLVVRMGGAFGLAGALFPALAAALLFLLSPYQTEVVVWRVCFSYLLSTALLLTALHELIAWLEAGKPQFPGRVLLLFTLALFTFELAFAFPLMSGGLLLVWAGSRAWPAAVTLRRGVVLLGPQLLLTGGYLLLNRLTLGVWIGHYGAETHLRYSMTETPGRFLQYTAKLLGFVRYFSHGKKEAVFSALMRPEVAVSAAVVLLVLAGLYLCRLRRLSPRLVLAGLVTGFYAAAILPVLPFFFNYLLYVENDRHSYFASAFLFAGAGLLAGGLPRFWKYLVLVAFLIPSAYLTWQTNQRWEKATGVYRALLDDFPHPAPDTVYLLNLPDNYQGILLFRDYGGEARTLLDALRYLKRRPYEGALYEVASYNMTTPADSVTVARPAPDSLVVTFGQWGNWWWRDGVGAGNEENGPYRFRNQGHHYELKWKNAPPGGVILMQQGKAWRALRGR